MQVVEGLHMAERTAGARAYLVVDGGSCLLVDTGGPDGTLGVGHLLESVGRRPHEVRMILLTHGHAGHAGNVDGLRRLTGAPVAATAAVAVALADPRPGGRWPPWGRRPALAAQRVDRVVEPGEVLELMGGVEVVDAPGHAAGSVAFRLPQLGVLCVGDAASTAPGGLVPPPLRHCADPDAAVRTAAALGALAGRVVAPGHGLPTVDGRPPARRVGR